MNSGSAPVDAPPPIIELEHAAVEGRRDAATPSPRDIDWRICPGEFWVVGGSAGSGKTRLLETTAGLRLPASGTLRLFGARADTLSTDAARATRRRLGFVYGAGGRLFSHLTLAQNLALPLCYHRNCRPEAVEAEVDRLLAQFELQPLALRLPGQVNGACRQRAALARALTLAPEVLFLDDPLAELNTAQVHWWLNWLTSPPRPTDLRSPPATIVVATDDLRPWLADHRQYALLHDGRWQVLGGREQLAASPESLRRELLAEPPVSR
ncbi:MAG: ATP-binding cassette domain-containing protein [Verrucomicrobiales bacterium]|nr:ATP-binding cassette domain-containing protein [Verrucomicrobiales bacterium]